MEHNKQRRTLMFRTTSTKKSIAIVGLLAVTLAACSSNEKDTSGTEATAAPAVTAEPQPAVTEPVTTAESVTVTNAWARSVPGGKGAIYAEILSTADDAILSASIEPATAAGKVEIHEVVTGDDGMMKMQMVERIPLTAGQITELKPGSYHIMLMDMPEVLDLGTRIEVTLVLENAGPVTFTATVRENTMPDMSGDMSGDMSSGMGGDMGADMGGGMSTPSTGMGQDSSTGGMGG
jgi:hypothetical protein